MSVLLYSILLISTKLYWAEKSNFSSFSKVFVLSIMNYSKTFYEKVWRILLNSKVATYLWNHTGFTVNNWALWISGVIMQCGSHIWETWECSPNLVVEEDLWRWWIAIFCIQLDAIVCGIKLKIKIFHGFSTPCFYCTRPNWKK